MKDIAIIGFSGVFPDANSVQEFSNNLLNGKCSINKITETRLFETTVSDKIEYLQAGYLEDITHFDHDFFGIPLGEAEEMTPHQRLILQEAYKTFENAGYRVKDIKGTNTSVYLTNTNTNYYLLAKEPTPTLIAGNTIGIMASRISRFFDLRGAAINIDTTCSSGLTAITLACKDIMLEETDLALVCGAQINIIPEQKDSKAVLGVDAKSEVCSPFSDRADGTMSGEAVTGILLKSFDKAQQDGDIIYGVIKGFATNQDASLSASIMAPSSDAQAEVIRKALNRAGFLPNDITFIEAHGTGTKLGDPIEIEGISQVFGSSLNDDEKVLVSAVKSNIGHTDGVAGIVGVIKVLLSFKNNIIYPSINALPLSSFIDFEKAKVDIVTKPIHWDDVKKNNKKIAGVSSFGLMGTNAHLILESFEKEAADNENTYDEYIFCFSAKSNASLLTYLESFKNYLITTDDSLHDISFTLNNNREWYPHRFSITAKSKNELIEILSKNDNIKIVNIAENNQNCILVFDDLISIGEALLNQIDSFEEYKDKLTTDAQKSILVQYASFQKLVESGVLITDMIGIGLGKITLEIIKSEITLEQALQKGENYLNTTNDTDELTERAKKLISKYPNGLQIIEVGYQGQLGQIFENLATEECRYHLIGYEQSIYGNIRTLFNLNLNSDPMIYSKNEKYHRVALPAYCFEQKRCWLRTTDNPYNPNQIHQPQIIVEENNNQLSIVDQLILMWNEILKTDTNENDDFFELGGHSLNGLQLINQINKRFSLEFTIDTLFENGTPKEMAEAVVSETKKNVVVPVQAVMVEKSDDILPVEKQEYYEVSFAQKRLWLLAQMSNNTASLTVPIVITLDGELEYKNLNKAFELLLQRHESLRTSFKFIDDQLKQKIHDYEKIENKIEFVEKEKSSRESLNDYIHELIMHPFDLESYKLIRMHVIKQTENKHIIVVALHHLICDGWSLTVFQKEFFSIYNTLCTQKQPQLEPLKIHYKDYANWQIKESQKSSFLQNEAFWLEQFSTPYPLLDLQLQQARPALKTYNGQVETLGIPQDLVKSFKELLKQEGLTLTMFLGSVLNILLSKLSGQSDIILGLPITNRNHLQLENQIGLYLNTIVIRSAFNSEISIKDFLDYMSVNFKAAYKHQDYPFELLLEKLQIQKDLSRSPLFDVAFTVQNFLNIDISNSLDNLVNQEVTIKPYELDQPSGAQFDLFFRFIDGENDFKYELEFNTDLFTTDAILAYHNFIINIIEQCVQNRELKIKDVSLTSNEDVKQISSILNSFNSTKVVYPNEKTVVELFKDQVKNSPDSIALKDDFCLFTYAQLDQLSDQIASNIISKFGKENNSPIAVLVGRSANMVALLLGILKTGRAYIPLDPTFPKDRLTYIIEQSQINILIQENELQFEISNNVVNLSLEDILKEEKDSYKKEIKEITQNDTAYIIYTSGSTGNPKGVEIGHKSLVNFLISMQKGLLLNDKDCLFSVTTYSFDISILEFFAPLISGSTVYVADHNVLSSPSNIIEHLEKVKPSIIQATPSFYQLLFNAGWKGDKNLKVLCGGDRLSEVLAEKLIENCGEVWNMYGPTETTIWSSMKLLHNPKDATNIGKPIHNTQFFIFDEFMNLLPIGFSGALYIAGDGLAKGYYKNDELTKERFKINPLDESTLLYETGDVGRWNKNGEIEFLGRNDHQVKIRGFRIELGDIEHAISQSSNFIKQVVVEAKEVNGEKVLVAYFVANETIDKTEIRNFLQGKLPDYMIPSFYLELDAFPLTPNKKVDRKALPNISTSDILKKEYIAPSNNIEQELVEIWQEVLGVEKIGIRDHFFELGGHSLIMAQVINRVQKQLGLTISFTTFFENPTIEGLSGQSKLVSYLPITKIPEALDYAVTTSQSRLWILSQLEGGSLAYNMPAAVKLNGDLDVQTFKESFQYLIQRHEILRTYFKNNSNGEIRQSILSFEETQFDIELKEFSHYENKNELIANYLQEVNFIPFNLEKAPLLRASLIKLNDEENVFFLSMHHIISDGWSIQILIAEIVEIYNALIQNQNIDITPLAIQYKDYVAWYNETTQQEKYSIAEQYWLEKFEGELPVLNLPSFKSRPLNQTFNGDDFAYSFSKSFLEKIKSFSKEHEVTLFMTLMTGINALFHRYTGVNDIILGTPIAGREHPDLENQIGLYLNTLAIRTKWEGNKTFLDLLSIQKQTLIEAYDHQNYPFDALVQQLNLKRDNSRSALFDVLVVLQNQAQLNNFEKNELTNLEVSEYNFERKTSQFDMSLTFIETDRLDLIIEYNTDIYDKSLIEYIAIHFENLMSEFLDNPKSDIATVDYITIEEKQQLLNEFNSKKVDYPVNQTIIDLLEEQVNKTPNKIAVVFEDNQLTYKELNERANKFAHYLREKYTINPDDLIGIKLQRNERMIISILGVLKSGAAYVPIDPSYPQERIDYIEKDSACKVVIDEVELEKFDQVQNVCFDSNPERIHEPQHLAYIIYTSGTTGTPKGVMIEHKSLLDYVLTFLNYFNVKETDTILSQSTISFDTSIEEIFPILCVGGKMIVVEDNKDFNTVFHLCKNHHVSILSTNPFMIDFFNSSPELQLPSLKTIISGGDVLKKDYINNLISSVRIYNSYGPTETTVCATYFEVKNNSQIGSIPIGSPIPNKSIYIIDEKGMLVPQGVYGRICIAGSGIARGYLSKAELTDEKFINNPFASGTKMYDTGDLGRWLPDGNIEFQGRADDQVKIRGNRIELGDVEHALKSFSDSISQAFVTIKEKNNEKTLVAYLVSTFEINKVELRSFLQKKLPDYMIPSFYVTVSELPLTDNGKIDKKALPDISENDLIRREYEAPNNDVEQVLIDIWQDILKIDQIGVRDNFFELGGTSLQIIKLHHRIELFWPQIMAISDLFEFNNIKDIANYILKNSEQTSVEVEKEEIKFFEI